VAGFCDTHLGQVADNADTLQSRRHHDAIRKVFNVCQTAYNVDSNQ